MRRILITNDDGIGSDGLRRLAAAAVKLGEVWVVAPDGERSAASHSVTLHAPVDVYPHSFPVQGVQAYSCSGMPADCVRIGVLGLMKRKPDLVLTGINYGFNVATDTQYSATIGAAMEAAFQGCRAIALSEAAHPGHEAAVAYLPKVLAELADRPLGWGEIFSVNFPSPTKGACRGILWDRTVSRGTIYRDSYNTLEELPGGGLRFMVEGHYNEDAEPGTDLRAVMDGYVSVGIVRNIG